MIRVVGVKGDLYESVRYNCPCGMLGATWNTSILIFSDMTNIHSFFCVPTINGVATTIVCAFAHIRLLVIKNVWIL